MRVRLKFTDLPLGFDPQDNVYVRALAARHEVEFAEDPDFVFYGPFGTAFLRYPQSVRIFMAVEPILPNFNDCDYAIGAQRIDFGERYFRHPPMIGYGEKPFWTRFLPEPGVEAFERPFCNFIYSNAKNGEGARLRVAFCQRLAKYRHVDCLGRVLNNVSENAGKRYGRGYGEKSFNTNWEEEKIACQSGYKFTIAFENTRLPGFATDKLIDPLLAHSIPIYWGDPAVAEYFNRRAFIDSADYGDDLDALVNAVIELDGDREKYMAMLREPPIRKDFPFDWEKGLAEYLDGIVRRGRKPFDKNPIGFASMSAQSVGELCRNGKAGLGAIARMAGDALAGWAQYKIHRESEKK